MGILKLFSKSNAANFKVDRLPTGALAVNRAGSVIACTLPTTLKRATRMNIGRTVLRAFAASRKINVPLSELVMELNGMRIIAHEMRGGALIFFHPKGPTVHYTSLPSMSNPNIDDFVLYLETYIECWKQFNHYVNLARMQKFTPEDESQFLETKSLIAQGLEVILAAVEQGGPRKDEVMSLINSAPSIRYLAEHENMITTVEGQWHKGYLSMQSLLGRLKVKQQKQDGEWTWGSLFSREK